MSEIVSNSRCKTCGKNTNISNLKDNPSGCGLICINTEECNKRKLNLKKVIRNTKK